MVDEELDEVEGVVDPGQLSRRPPAGPGAHQVDQLGPGLARRSGLHRAPCRPASERHRQIPARASGRRSRTTRWAARSRGGPAATQGGGVGAELVDSVAEGVRARAGRGGRSLSRYRRRPGGWQPPVRGLASQAPARSHAVSDPDASAARRCAVAAAQPRHRGRRDPSRAARVRPRGRGQRPLRRDDRAHRLGHRQGHRPGACCPRSPRGTTTGAQLSGHLRRSRASPSSRSSGVVVRRIAAGDMMYRLRPASAAR